MSASAITSTGLAELPILEILKLGISGLCFLLFLLSFILLYMEQKRNPLRDNMLKAIRFTQIVAIILTLLVGISSAVPSVNNPPPVSNQDSISNAKTYPNIVNFINDILNKKTCIYLNRTIIVDFEEITIEHQLLLNITQTTKVNNPTDKPIEKPYKICTTDEEFQYIEVFKQDITKPDYKGQIDWKLNKDQYRDKKVISLGNTKIVEVGYIRIPPGETIIVETKYKVKKPFDSEIAFTTGAILVGDLYLRANPQKLRSPSKFFKLGSMQSGFDEYELINLCDEDSRIYIMKGLKFPGHGIVLTWQYNPSN